LVEEITETFKNSKDYEPQKSKKVIENKVSQSKQPFKSFNFQKFPDKTFLRESFLLRQSIHQKKRTKFSTIDSIFHFVNRFMPDFKELEKIR
jgi:hypothetical protein